MFESAEKKRCPFRMINDLSDDSCVNDCAWYRVSRTTGKGRCAFMDHTDAMDNIMKAVTVSLKMKLKEQVKHGNEQGD